MNRIKCMKIDIPTGKVEVKCENQSSQDGLVNLDPKKEKFGRRNQFKKFYVWEQNL